MPPRRRRSPAAAARSVPPVAAFRAACATSDVGPEHTAALGRLLRSWNWSSVDPGEQIDELLDEYRAWRAYLRSRDGDPDAARQFEREWRSYARRALGWRMSASEIEEVLSSFFARVYQRIGADFAWTAPFRIYLRTVLLNESRSHLRRAVRRRRREVDLGRTRRRG